MNIEAALSWVEDHIDYTTWAARSGRTGNVHLSLDRMRAFVDLLGNPQRQLDVIHVSGTNGKGSTSKMITRLLMAEGLTVGTYSSPHLSTYNERFRIDAVEIEDTTLAELLATMMIAEDKLGDRLMPFEVLTGAAFSWFADRHVDVAVVEVGVLGRFDATNVADGRVAVVTNIGFDHTDGTGDWQQRIAGEKAGIVKPGAHLILGPIEARLADLFTAQQPADVWRIGTEIAITDDHATSDGRRCTVTTPWQAATIEIPLRGAHQSVNGALALAAASAFAGRAIAPPALTAGFGAVRMLARMESFTVADGVTVILDGAHNPDAAAALTRALRDDLPRTGRRTLLVGLLAGRDPETMLRSLAAPTFDRVIGCTPPTARARPANEIVSVAEAMEVASVSVIDDVGEALTAVIANSAPGDQIIVTGSIYLVADARSYLTAAP